MIIISFSYLLAASLCLLGPRVAIRASPLDADILTIRGETCNNEYDNACLDIRGQTTEPVHERGEEGDGDDSCAPDADSALKALQARGYCLGGKDELGFAKMYENAQKIGNRAGRDQEGVPYILTDKETIRDRPVNKDGIRPVFYTAGSRRRHVRSFIQEKLGGQGYVDSQIWDTSDDDDLIKNNPRVYFLRGSRRSTAIAQSAEFEEVIVIMWPVDETTGQTRNIFSDIQKRDASGKITQAGVGQIFREAELPWLMRNLNVQRIGIAWKDKDEEWHVEIQWDAAKDLEQHPRDEFPTWDWDEMNIVPQAPGTKR